MTGANPCSPSPARWAAPGFPLKAADFIAAHFEKLGLPKIGNDGSYFQKIAFTAESWDNGQIELTINGENYRHLSDFVSFPSANSNSN